VFFLDDALDCPDAKEGLIRAGVLVERFSEHFLDESGRKMQNVKDPEVIRFCNRRGYVLLTTDSNIASRHRTEIKKSKNLGILATAHNTVEDITIWVRAFTVLVPMFKKNSFLKRQRPWFGKFDTTGKICSSIRTLSDD
jgi:hypothetical protein